MIIMIIMINAESDTDVFYYSLFLPTILPPHYHILSSFFFPVLKCRFYSSGLVRLTEHNKIDFEAIVGHSPTGESILHHAWSVT
jgi:hypothetical protein